ncbi:MAG: hypothetical protein QG555_583 [Thermodesulfobacteriota bacterium]|nr:hypothetical protein [Thermodesulfobacteriota bacterium]
MGCGHDGRDMIDDMISFTDQFIFSAFAPAPLIESFYTNTSAANNDYDK